VLSRLNDSKYLARRAIPRLCRYNGGLCRRGRRYSYSFNKKGTNYARWYRQNRHEYGGFVAKMTPEDFAKLPELVRLLIVGEAAKRVSHHPKAYSMSRKVKDLALFEMARRNYGLLDEISHLRSELDLWKTRGILRPNASNRVDIISELGGGENNDKKILQDELDKANRAIAELKVQLRTEGEDREKR
jgi:hypothetical protein